MTQEKEKTGLMFPCRLDITFSCGGIIIHLLPMWVKVPG
jgi:hypothetical protein